VAQASATALVILVLLACASLTSAVDRNKFKTCDKASFCKRLRAHDQTDATKVSAPTWEVVADSIAVATDGHSLTAALRNTHFTQQPRLRLTLDLLRDLVIRLRVTEQDGKHPRYVVNDVLQPVGLSSVDASHVKHGFQVCVWRVYV
jgi:hypothetical protein